MSSTSPVEFRIELVHVPVADVDRAKAFYVDQLGWPLDHDHTVSDEVRFVQITPPGSACSIAIGKGTTPAQPGSLEAVQLVVTDIEAAHADLTDLTDRGVDVTGIDDYPWGSFVGFADPDGNRFAVQSVVPRGSGSPR